MLTVVDFQFVRCLLWFILDCDLPEDHPRVSQEVISDHYDDCCGDNGDHYEDWCDEDDHSSVQEKDLILSSRSFDPVKSQKLLSGNIFLLLRDMLKNK